MSALRFHPGVSLLLAATAACASPAVRRAPAAAQVLLDTRPPMLEIAALEDARSDGDGRLEALLRDGDAAVRARAALALGRLSALAHGERVNEALQAAIALDEDVGVRMAALFAIGQRGDPALGSQVLALTQHEDSRVRARAVEALAKLPRPDLRGAVLSALSDATPAVRLEAAHGPHRWPRDDADAGEVDAALARALQAETERDVILIGLASLERRRAAAGLEAYLRYRLSPDGELRVFAVRGLSALAPREDVREALVDAAVDADWRVQCEALVGLAAFEDDKTLRALGAATRAPSAHVRRRAWETLAGRAQRAATLDSARAIEQGLREFWLDAKGFQIEPSQSVRAAFLELELPLLSKLRRLDRGWTTAQSRDMVAKLDAVVAREPATVLCGLARALAHIEEGFALEMLTSLSRVRDRRVSEAAIEALASKPGDVARQELLARLGSSDNGVRLAALLALESMLRPEDVAAIESLYDSSRGEVGPEVRFNAVRLAHRVSPENASGLVAKALSDDDAYVRQVAQSCAAVAASGAPPRSPSPLPIAGQDFPLYERNPRVEVVTSRGSMVFELFPAEAPLHVHSFLTLAGRHAYDGLSFHRVVPDFVVQGGDPRGDGNGGSDWRGGSLRQEIGPRKYVRGSLGMPRNDDPESGGGQFFVTHRPTPHLDGRYTIFGELRAGGDVLDEIEVGDTILEVRTL